MANEPICLALAIKSIHVRYSLLATSACLPCLRDIHESPHVFSTERRGGSPLLFLSEGTCRMAEKVSQGGPDASPRSQHQQHQAKAQ